MGCDPAGAHDTCVHVGFQSTHPSGVRLPAAPSASHAWHDFNPRTPVGCDRSSAPNYGQIIYFNPRTPVGCDLSSSYVSVVSWSFQSTHPSGVRREAGRLLARPYISIHAPQWGATGPELALGRIQRHFNPRTPVGCDSNHVSNRYRKRYFNPRTPVGCDVSSWTSCVPCRYFNPRTPVGCDFDVRCDGASRSGISIHAPPWGATSHDGVVVLSQ